MHVLDEARAGAAGARRADDGHDAVVLTDAEGRVLEFNAAFARIFGVTQPDARHRPLGELIIPPRFRPAYRALRRQALTGAASPSASPTREFSALGADGGEFAVELSVARTSEDPPRVATRIRDLDQVQATSARSTGRRLALHERAEELAGIGSWELGLATGELLWSDNMFRLYGLKPGEIVPTAGYVFAHTHPRDRERVVRSVEELRRTGRLSMLRYRYVLPDGSVRHVQATMTVLAEAPGVPPHTLGTLQDVTQQRWADQEIAARFAVSEALDDWHSGDLGAKRLLRDLGEALDFEGGILWVPHGDVLVRQVAWEGPSLSSPLPEVRLKAGVGLAGTAWAARRPVTVASITEDPGYPLRDLAAEAGLKGALAFPTTFGDEVLAVLGFVCQDEVKLTDRLVRSLIGIGYEIGHFFARRRGELIRAPLSQRELEVLQLAATGCNAAEIACKLDLSPWTIKSHFEHIYKKLGVHDRASAVGYAVRQGLIA